MVYRWPSGIVSVLFLTCGLVASAQEEAHPLCACKPREVGRSGSRNDWEGYKKAVKWHYSVEEAMKIARAEGRMVFWQQIVGDLDKEGC